MVDRSDLCKRDAGSDGTARLAPCGRHRRHGVGRTKIEAFSSTRLASYHPSAELPKPSTSKLLSISSSPSPSPFPFPFKSGKSVSTKVNRSP